MMLLLSGLLLFVPFKDFTISSKFTSSLSHIFNCPFLKLVVMPPLSFIILVNKKSCISPSFAAAAIKPLQLCLTLCDPTDGCPLGSPVPGILQARTLEWEHWSGLPFPSPMHESEKRKWSHSVAPTLSDPMDCSLPGFSVHEVFQARVLEWGAVASSTKNTMLLLLLLSCFSHVRLCATP